MSRSSSPVTPSVTIHDLLVGSTSETDSETGSDAGYPYAGEESASFCQAIVLYHSCGCRTPEPLFCCRPVRNQQHKETNQNPCQHQNPALVVAVLPISCNLRIGNTAACSAEDPGAKEFVREVDTAETLDLVVLEPAARRDIRVALPARLAVGSSAKDAVTVNKVKKHSAPSRPRISARAPPFVPRSFVIAQPTSIGNPLLHADPAKDGEVTTDIVEVADIPAEVEEIAGQEPQVRSNNDVQQHESKAEDQAVDECREAPRLILENAGSELGEVSTKPNKPSGDLLLFWGIDDEKDVEVVAPPTQNWLTSFLGRLWRVFEG